MTNHRMYQAKYKEKYIETINNKVNMQWLFDKTFEFEMRLSKDLFDFNKEELMDFLKSRNMSYSTLVTNRTYISNYLDWAIKNGYMRINRNAADEISNTELKTIMKPEKELLNIEEIDNLITKDGYNLKNDQDRLLIYLIFLGVGGNKAHELINLKFEHVDKENMVLKLSELEPTRKDLPIDEYCLELIDSVRSSVDYIRYMDDTNYDTFNTLESYELVESDYIFKKMTAGRQDLDDPRLTYQGILRRIRTISKYAEMDLTIKKIKNSGIVYFGKLILDAGYQLRITNEVVKKSIFDRYDITSESGKYVTLGMINKEIPKIYKETVS